MIDANSNQPEGRRSGFQVGMSHLFARSIQGMAGIGTLFALGASPAHAALVNGTAVQGYEIDDANQACFHACAVVLSWARTTVRTSVARAVTNTISGAGDDPVAGKIVARNIWPLPIAGNSTPVPGATVMDTATLVMAAPRVEDAPLANASWLIFALYGPTTETLKE